MQHWQGAKSVPASPGEGVMGAALGELAAGGVLRRVVGNPRGGPGQTGLPRTHGRSLARNAPVPDAT